MPLHTYVNNAVIDLVFLDHCNYKQQAGRGTHQTVYYPLAVRLFPPNLWYISVPNTRSGFPPNFSSLCDATAWTYYHRITSVSSLFFFAILCSCSFAYFKHFFFYDFVIQRVLFYPKRVADVTLRSSQECCWLKGDCGHLGLNP